jgi:hypothetical protein
MKTLKKKYIEAPFTNRHRRAFLALMVSGLTGVASAQFSVGTQVVLQDGSIFSSYAPNGLFPFVNQASTADGNSEAFARCQGRITAGEYVLLKLSCYDRDNPFSDYYQSRTIARMTDRILISLPEWARHELNTLHLRVRLHGTMRVPTGLGWSGTQPYGLVGISATYTSGGPNSYRTMAGEAFLQGGAWPGNITYADLDYSEAGTQNVFLNDINALPAPRTENGYLIWNIDNMIYIPLLDAWDPNASATENTVTLQLWAKGVLGNPESGVLINGSPPTCVADFANSVSLALDGFGPLVADIGEDGDTTPIPLPAGTVYKFGEQDEEVTAPEPPELRIETIVITHDAVVIRFNSLGGARYAVDYASRLENLSSSNTVSSVGAENVTDVIVPMASPAQGFYRVRYD